MTTALVEAQTASKNLAWKSLPPIPDAKGFAGSFAGMDHGVLLVAGGANFPDKPPTEGGTKTWYDSVFVLETPISAWKTGFKLPFPLGYGVSIHCPQGLICIGGSSATQHHAEVFLLSYASGKVSTKSLPSLPSPCANMCGALVGHTIFVTGGIATPDATNALNSLWSLDIKDVNAGWIQLEPCPGAGRIFGAAGADHGNFILTGGASLTAGTNGKPVRIWLKDTWSYTPRKGWKKLADLPQPSVAAPSPMPFVNGCLLLGGDDGTQLSATTETHRGFPVKILHYNAQVNQWTEFGKMPIGLVTTTMAEWNGKFIVAGGEVKPGVRSTAVWAGEVVP